MRVGAIQNGQIRMPATPVQVLAQTVGDELRLVVLVERGIELDRLAFAAVGPQILAEAVGVLGDQSVGGLENGAGGAVVLFELDDFGAGEILLEADHVLDFCAAPTIDRLVIIANNHQLIGVPR